MSVEETLRLDGRTALVTGASRGIGRQAALTLGAAGASVVVAARSKEDLGEVAAAARRAGAPDAIVVPTDVLDEEAVQAAVAAAVDSTGRLDVVVNVAGGQGSPRMPPTPGPRVGQGVQPQPALGVRHLQGGHGPPASGRVDRERGQHRRVHGQPRAGRLRRGQGGRDRAHPHPGRRGRPHGVRVNCLAPGWVRTELTRRMWSDPETSRALVAQVPLGRWADVEELAGPLLLLASDAGSYITGATLVVDGGLLA